MEREATSFLSGDRTGNTWLPGDPRRHATFVLVTGRREWIRRALDDKRNRGILPGSWSPNGQVLLFTQITPTESRYIVGLPISPIARSGHFFHTVRGISPRVLP